MTFDLFNGEAASQFKLSQWVPGWRFNVADLPLERGKFSDGDDWLLVGEFFSDEETSIILERYKLLGIQYLFELDGEFILVVHSNKDQTVRLYRDRTGIYPIVYGKGEKGFAVSLWFDNVVSLAGIKAEPSRALLDHWPVYRVAIIPDTPIQGIKSLSGRKSLLLKDGLVIEEEHAMSSAMGDRYNSLDTASRELGETLDNAVRKRIRGKKDIGAWLSGGNDSSLLVALARRHYQDKITTVFVTFEDCSRNYRDYARQVAQKYAADHTEIEVSAYDYLHWWIETVVKTQSPINHPGTVGQAAALNHISGSVKTMLAGEGADTVFGGPYWAPFLSLSQLGKILPTRLRKKIYRTAMYIHEKNAISKIAAKGLRALGSPLEDYVHSENAFGKPFIVNRVFGKDTWERTMHTCKNYIKDDTLTGLFLFHMLDWNPATVAAEMRLGFHYGLLFLFPFLDYKIMQNSLKLPPYLRYHYSTKKASLKKFARNFFDDEFIYKPKEGFGVPLGKWFARPMFKDLLWLALEERSLKRGWWSERELREIIVTHQSGEGNDKSAESVPWIVTNLELWTRICIEGDSPELYMVN